MERYCSSPELWSTTIEHSADGTNWSRLGQDIRTGDGWSLSGVALANGEIVRARGYVSVGQYNSGSWSVSSQVTNGAPLTVSARPSIASSGVRSGRAVFSVTAQNCQRLIVESSVDLQTWMAVQTNAVGTGTVGLEFSAPQASHVGWQFYRVRQE